MYAGEIAAETARLQAAIDAATEAGKVARASRPCPESRGQDARATLKAAQKALADYERATTDKKASESHALLKTRFNYPWRVRGGLLGFGRSRFPIVPMGQCVVETRNGFCIKPVPGPTPHKMLKLNALTPGGLDTAASKHVRVSEKTAAQFHIRRGDLLVCRSVGSYDHIAKCALVREDDPSILFPDIMIRARLTEAALPDYIRQLIQSSVGRSHFQSNARTAVGMWKIGSEDIRKFPLPLPPLAVQRRMMEKVAAGRARIARERETARALARQIEADMEAYLLETKKVPEQGS